MIRRPSLSTLTDTPLPNTTLFRSGSTISLQLALNLFGSGRANSFPVRVMQKLREWVTAVRLERRYTKQEIIAMYLNTVDFGNNSFGIKMAARSYFDTTPEKLTVNRSEERRVGKKCVSTCRSGGTTDH